MKKLKVTVNGKVYDVVVEEADAEAEMNKEIEFENKEKTNVKLENASNQAHNDDKHKEKNGEDGESINAPMPGAIVSVNVSVGQKVSKGDTLVILEAMKMENEISAPKDAEVVAVKVKKGDMVESGASLVILR